MSNHQIYEIINISLNLDNFDPNLSAKNQNLRFGKLDTLVLPECQFGPSTYVPLFFGKVCKPKKYSDSPKLSENMLRKNSAHV